MSIEQGITLEEYTDQLLICHRGLFSTNPDVIKQRKILNMMHTKIFAEIESLGESAKGLSIPEYLINKTLG